MAISEVQLLDYNEAALKWARLTRDKLRFALASQGLENQIRADGRASLVKSLRSGSRKDSGVVSSIRFVFAVHGWFYERGVGRGVPLEKVAGSLRRPRPWMAAIEENLVALGDEIAERVGDNVIDNIRAVR